MTGTTASDSRDLLRAGAVLPAGTEGAGASAVDLTARTYRHPALGEERVVVRLAAAELGPAEDLAAGYLGLEPQGDPVVVGLGQRQELGFPEWVLVHHPADGHHALAVVPELDRMARQAKTKPGAALDACHELAGRLASAVPHFLPVFYEQAARIFLGVDNTTYAGQLFGRARTAEAQHGLTVDEDRLDAVFLEFALAGALPVKVLTGYGKELAARLAPAEAYGRFRRLCVRRTAGGLAPSAQAATELRRLARAAGLSGPEEEQGYLAELLPLPATARATAGWWKSHRSALVALARREPAVRGVLLSLTPPVGESDLGDLWLEILTESGADAGLTDPDAPREERCADGAAGWLERFHTARHRGWGSRPALRALLGLVERAAGRLRAEAAVRPEGALRIGVEDVDLLDLLLAHEVPVADPPPGERHARHPALNLADWARGERSRDLVALAADPRFRVAFRNGANGLGGGASGVEVMRWLAAAPGSRLMLAAWVAEVARGSFSAGLPGVPEAIERLSWLPAEVLALAPDEVAAAASADLGETLARTLRSGLWEELHWPAWEEALAALAPAHGGLDGVTAFEAWPYLIVANATQVRVVDAGSTVLTHDLRVPASRSGRPLRHGFHFVDGELLVFWTSYGNERTRGYWHTAPDRVFELEGDAGYWSMRSPNPTLPLPGGGRTTGGGVLHRGDTKLPPERPLVSDGTSYWVWGAGDGRHDDSEWTEYDPATGTYGRRSRPGFLADAARAHGSGAELSAHASWLRPAPSVPGSALGAPVDGLLGWRVARLPGGGWHAEDTAGRRVDLPEGSALPVAALLFPGDNRPRAVTQEWRTLSLSDPDGVVTVTAHGDTQQMFATAAGALPPLSHLYALRPRDTEGSAALRAVDAGRAGTLLKAAAAAERAADLPGLVGAALPEVTAPEVVAGVVKALRFAVTQQKALDDVAARTDPSAERPAVRVEGPADRLISEGLRGLVGSGYQHRGSDHDVLHRFLEAMEAARDDTSATARPELTHFDLPSLPYSGLPLTALLGTPSVIAYRAVAPGGAGHRDVLLGVLDRLDALGLTSAAASDAHWRRVLVHLGPAHLRTPDGVDRPLGHRGVLPLGGGAVLGITEHHESVADGAVFGALLHDPEGRFEVPGPYTARGGEPVGDPVRAADWAARFLREARSRGEIPFPPEAAEEFGRLTGASGAVSRLVLAGLPHVDSWENNFLPGELRKALGLKVSEAAQARDELRALSDDTRRAVVAALLPGDPARLWDEGPDAASAAAVWNARVGRRTPVPDWLSAEASRAAHSEWPVLRALPALLDPAASPELSTDVAWHIKDDRAATVAPAAAPFTTAVLNGSVALMAWLAHRLPAGDPVRAVLPDALTAVRQRLASPELLLPASHFINLVDFRTVAGAPTETAPDHERYGAVLMATHDTQPQPALRTALLDSTGSDPYLVALRGQNQHPTAVETALRRVYDPVFARLLADPGAPVEGGTDADGTWWPQDPSRSVPALVAEVASAHGLGADAAALYLMLLALPDPTDRDTARWTGWKPARLKAARAELAAGELVVQAVRARAGRSLFLPGPWAEQPAPALPVEQWKLSMYGPVAGVRPVLGALVPVEPVAELFVRAWRRTLDGDVPCFEELKVKRTRRRR